MILQEHKRKSSVVEAKYKHYPTFKRIREFEQMFEQASRERDFHQASYYDNQIKLLFAKLGMIG